MDAMVRAKEHLEENTLLPLEHLLQRTQFTEGIIRDMYECQTEILQGNDQGDVGYANRLRVVLEKQHKLKRRIDAVGETLQRQKNLAASALSVSLSTQAKISHAEKVYGTQLRNWNAVCDRLQATIATLQQSKRFVDVVSNPNISTPKPTHPSKSAQSPVGGTRRVPLTRRDVVSQQRRHHPSGSPYFPSPIRRTAGSNGAHASPGASSGAGTGGYQRRSEAQGACSIFLSEEEVEACTQLLSAEVRLAL